MSFVNTLANGIYPHYMALLCPRPPGLCHCDHLPGDAPYECCYVDSQVSEHAGAKAKIDRRILSGPDCSREPATAQAAARSSAPAGCAHWDSVSRPQFLVRRRARES